jgi:glycosyltransferase involved in cell wall biosynthesis
MRIVFVAHHGTVHTRRWITFFAERGHEVHVVTCGGGDADDEDDEGRSLPRRYEVHDLGPPQLGKLGYLLKIPAARRVVRRLRPDVVHAHWATSYGLLALAAGVHPLVVTAHGDDVLIAPGNPLLRPIVKRVLRAADAVTVPSEHMRAAVHELVGAKRVEVFQYGVETERLAALASTARAEAEGPLRIVSARPLLELYRVDVLLDALAGLDRPFAADIAGDGPERLRLESQAQRLGLADRVRFHGQVAPHRVEKLIADAHVYVSVASSDGTSLALLEALALGAVPVLSDIPANASWIEDGETGVLVEATPVAVREGIVRAAGLDRAGVAERNLRTVSERADRQRNLGRCERLLQSVAEAA